MDNKPIFPASDTLVSAFRELNISATSLILFMVC